MAKATRSTVFAAALLVLASCGGGGAGGGNGSHTSYEISFSPPAIDAQVTQGAIEPGITVNATLNQAATGSFYVFIDEDGPVLDLTRSSLTPESMTSASAYLVPSCELSPGTYGGVLTAHLCLDQECAQELPLSGNALPYTFTVSPGFLVTAKVDGVQPPVFAAACHPYISFPADIGQSVELTATAPVTWSTSVVDSAGVPCTSGATSTAMTWSATMSQQSSTVYPNVVGAIDVTATPAGAAPLLNVSIGVPGLVTGTATLPGDPPAPSCDP